MSSSSGIPNTRPALLLGDAVARLKELSAGSVQTCVTSPPYWGLRDYGVDDQLGLEATPEEYVSNLIGVFREVRRVLRDDGTLWLVIGDCYAGSRKGQMKGGSHAAIEGDSLQRRAKGTLTGGLPVGYKGCKPKDLVGAPWMVAFALRADGWYLRSDIVWNKPNPMPESVTDRPTKSHEYIFLLTKSASYYYDRAAIIEPFADARQGGRNARSVWNIVPKSYRRAHFATFPEELVERCIKAATREGDSVIDPFVGSGTTCAVAARLARASIGIELNPEYLKLAQERCWHNSRSLYECLP